MEGTHGNAEIRAGGGDASSRMHMHTGPRDPQAGDTSARIRELAGRTRDRVDDGVGRAGEFLRGGAGAVAAIRAKPLAAVGLAFSVGFVLAVGTGGRRRMGALDRFRRRIKAVLVTGATAAVAQELKSLVSEEDLSDLLAAWKGRISDEVDEFL